MRTFIVAVFPFLALVRFPVFAQPEIPVFLGPTINFLPPALDATGRTIAFGSTVTPLGSVQNTIDLYVGSAKMASNITSVGITRDGSHAIFADMVRDGEGGSRGGSRRRVYTRLRLSTAPAWFGSVCLDAAQEMRNSNDHCIIRRSHHVLNVFTRLLGLAERKLPRLFPREATALVTDVESVTKIFSMLVTGGTGSGFATADLSLNGATNENGPLFLFLNGLPRPPGRRSWRAEMWRETLLRLQPK